MSDQGEKTCPLCAEEMDLTDQQLKPCKKIKGKVQAMLKTRCSPKKIGRIMEFINKNDEMKRAVEEMGFGTLRDVPNVQLDLKFIKMLLDGFDIGQCSIFGEIIKVEDATYLLINLTM
ncbi:hypothetical protein POM88_000246 [Heracleum sosnowskyi]|uniref:Uncharacterized protein n=1 Tax=Heracleum sosnowskyi TaxID=360622 RepID=A0AAD8JBF3_9APIA|nr:hypothetical protein POM88_000246 [Heracleum sosnowskyi]